MKTFSILLVLSCVFASSLAQFDDDDGIYGTDAPVLYNGEAVWIGAGPAPTVGEGEAEGEGVFGAPPGTCDPCAAGRTITVGNPTGTDCEQTCQKWLAKWVKAIKDSCPAGCNGTTGTVPPSFGGYAAVCDPQHAGSIFGSSTCKNGVGTITLNLCQRTEVPCQVVAHEMNTVANCGKNPNPCTSSPNATCNQARCEAQATRDELDCCVGSHCYYDGPCNRMNHWCKIYNQCVNSGQIPADHGTSKACNGWKNPHCMSFTTGKHATSGVTGTTSTSTTGTSSGATSIYATSSGSPTTNPTTAYVYHPPTPTPAPPAPSYSPGPTPTPGPHRRVQIEA